MEGLKKSANKRDEDLNAVKADLKKVKNTDIPKIQEETIGLSKAFDTAKADVKKLKDVDTPKL